MAPNKGDANSDFRAFWSSLPGILTGTAAVVAAVGTLAAVFVGGDGADEPAPGTGITAEPTPAPSAGEPASASGAGEPPSASGSGVEGCFSRYFKGIPADRVGRVESGTLAYDVITSNQTKSGSIGVTFTRNGRPIGAIRFALIPENLVFRIESIVDERCRMTEDYDSATGGDKHVWQDSTPLRLRLADQHYGLTANGAGLGIRLAFVEVAP